MSSAPPVLGLDLGNSTCSVAVHRNGTVDVVPNEQGNRMTPSIVAFTDVETLLGEAAKAQLVRNPTNTVVDGLRLVGRKFADEDFQRDLAAWRFRVSLGKDGVSPQIDVQAEGKAKAFTPARLLSLLFARLRADAEAFTGEAVKEAVVAVPAHFDADKHAALKEAAQMGGVRVKLLLSAPLCAALLSVHGPPMTAAAAVAAAAAVGEANATDGDGAPDEARPQQLLVVDVGGSSCEVSVVEWCGRRRSEGGAKEGEAGGPGGAGGDGGARVHVDDLTVRATVQAAALGGATVDRLLRDRVVKEIKRRQRCDLSESSRTMARLLSACQGAKHSLTAAAQATVTVESEGVDYFSTVTRPALEDVSAPLAQKVCELAQQALDAAGATPPERIDRVVLAGGGCRMSRVQAALGALCPSAALEFAPVAEEVVCRGAALCGAMQLRGAPSAGGTAESTSELSERRALPCALGIAAGPGGGEVRVLAEKYSAVPLTRTMRFAVAPAGGDLLVTLVDADTAAPVARLPVRGVPEGTASLLVTLAVDERATIELACEAEYAAADGQPAPPRSKLAAVTVPPAAA